MNSLPENLLQNLIEKVGDLSTQLATLAGAVNQFQKTIDRIERNHQDQISDMKKAYHERFNTVAPLSLVLEHQSIIEEWKNQKIGDDAVKKNHSIIRGFIFKNWKFLAACVLAITGMLGSIDFALRLPSKEQEKVIHSLQYKVNKINQEV